ncbi:MAG TPA: 7TM-DISM domain-containing protein, partial [Burkholderiaceae bacterium]|nr:7TM-DISM domain-containing protein [Burkholderiaceae bacterium]
MAATAAVAAPLELRGDAGFHDAWPQLRALADPSGALTVEQARARLSEFAAPNTPRANFGVRRDALWLHLPLRVAADGGGDWVLSVEYPSLDRVDVYLFAGERLLQAHTLGRVMPQAGHRLPGRAHALQLRLAPAQSYDLLLRVQTQSTAIVPVYLIRTAQYLEREAQVQLVQGLLAGVGLCLIVYSLAQWLTLRERMFLDYAGMVFGMTAFFFTLNGLGPQHLWPDSAAPTTRVLLVSLLLAVAAGSLFVERALSLHEVSRRLVRLLRLTAAVASVVAVAFLAGAIDYRTAQGA